MFYDKSEYKDEIRDLKKAALRLAYRNNLRVASVTDPKLIKLVKKNSLTAHLFPEVGLSGCAI